MKTQATALLSLLAFALFCQLRSTSCVRPTTDDAADAVVMDALSGLDVSRCGTPFGTIIGRAHGVTARSNCRADVASNERNYFVRHCSRSYTGSLWRSDEFVRRYLVMNQNLTFQRVQEPFAVWDTVQYVKQTFTNIRYRLRKYVNNVSTDAPAAGDIIVYLPKLCPRCGLVPCVPAACAPPGELPNGHVAIIVAVTESAVRIAEQNWFENHMWQFKAQNFSRELLLQTTSLGGNLSTYSIIDPPFTIAGWKRLSKT